ncbi:MAG: glycosyltransferase family 10 domain-containing protein [Alphaproteobacteria bacterium]
MKRFRNIGIYLLVFCFCFGYGLGYEPRLKQAVFVVWPSGENNFHFLNTGWGSYVRSLFLKHGYDLNTQDIVSPQEGDIVLVVWKNVYLPEQMKGRAFLWLMETPLSVRVAIDEDVMKKYEKIFTYKRDLTHNHKYIYMPIPYDYQSVQAFPPQNKKEVLVMQIASNFSHHASIQNYEERRVAVKWFIQNAPADFMLYGSNSWQKFKNTLSAADKITFDTVYKGYAEDKYAQMKKAKFGLAYENAKFPGYISEKIFDVMAAASVPIYSGAPDIADFVPKECFINLDDYQSYDELYAFLKQMPDDVYAGYLECIKDFMFQPTHYNDTETIVKRLEQAIFPNSFNGWRLFEK